MSYCRWSSDDFRCDLYVYGHCDGTWTTHVAGSRYAGEVPPTPDLRTAGTEEYMVAYRAQRAYLDAAELEPIALPHAGATFKDAGPAECATTLRMLRDLGYRVPDYAIEGLDEEAAEDAADREALPREKDR